MNGAHIGQRVRARIQLGAVSQIGPGPNGIDEMDEA